MNILQVHPDNTIDLAYEGHRFTCALGAFAAGESPNAVLDPSVLVTPQLACTDPGCPYTCRSYFPLTGDATAQAIHMHVRAAKEGLAPDAARAAVAAAIEAAGGVARIDPVTLS